MKPSEPNLSEPALNFDAGRSMSTFDILKRPSAFVPVTMALAALAVVVTHVAISGTAREADEGTAAHLWQLLMAAQIPVVAFLMIKWLPQAPRSALSILALQVAVAAAALAPVYFLHL